MVGASTLRQAAEWLPLPAVGPARIAAGVGAPVHASVAPPRIRISYRDHGEGGGRKAQRRIGIIPPYVDPNRAAVGAPGVHRPIALVGGRRRRTGEGEDR